ncbi:tRNA epoxyqueuosine(34) reductase QueG [Sphingomonas sp. BIUV-7]|uniref:Epoxyqueuosine reductase n=1 Tax=Sphingomonas natans TaxID=3063330 RepID=A0ABT8Y3B5_9SPHN|nr:tRNA epoxyqueuosine(34) reductase QueG [Sphingomonas sp. BIUV-7]MDO6412801.1 tRNA epoxyqueuosine(34) reductase QueG [Sphingomonas sp. BIUV-7]
MPDAAPLETRLKAEAARLGFVACRIAAVTPAWAAGERLHAWIGEGAHGEMGWMEERAEQRAHPNALWAEARSAIMLGMSYAPPFDPLALADEGGIGRISVYAQGQDYHDIIKKALKALARWLVAEASNNGAALKVFVDTAPVMEKPLAARAGLGWQGKHTNLVSREHGSWLLLGAILTELELAPDESVGDACGSCDACQRACPTNAFPAPYRLDARRCISYLTIEHKGPIPHEFREGIGNRIYGCDDCLAVCPWNKFAEDARANRAFLSRAELVAPELADLLALDDAAFRMVFAGSPIKRIGRDRMVRNALIAAGNSRQAGLAETVTRLLDDPAPIVRGAAIWALRRLDPNRATAERWRLAGEGDDDVRSEWAGMTGQGASG